MRSINKVILIGNLTRDPELRQTPNGQNVVTFGLATNREWVTKDGRKQNSAEFHDLVAWAKLAEICNQYLKKGKLVYVEGYLKTRSWDTPEGTKKFRTEVVVQDMIMLDKRKEGFEDYIPEGEGEMAEEEEKPAAKEAKAEKKPVTGEKAVEKEAKAKEEPQAEETTPLEEKKPEEEKKSKEESKLDIDSDLGL